MDFLIGFLLSIILILIKIGDGVRFVIQKFFSIFYGIYKILLNLSIIKPVRSAPKKIPKSKLRPAESMTVKKSGNISARWGKTLRLISRLPGVYYESLRDALRFTMPFIRFRLISQFFIGIKTRIRMVLDRIKLFFSLTREKISPKPTPLHPFTIYPAPLHLAWRIQSFFAGILTAVLFLFVPYMISVWVNSLPNPRLLSQRDLAVSTKIFDRNGVLLYEIYADENRTPLPLAEIPGVMQKATISIEDRDFYNHQGFSVRSIIRAARETLINHHLQGGSTITQQLVKSALLTPEITLSRKIREIIMAFWAERIYSKNQILEMYLNQVPYGGTAWGVEAASQTYFGKTVKDLTLAEAALLAGLPAAPSQYSPFGTTPQLAIERQHEVLRRMTEDGYITKAEEDAALAEKLVFAQPRIGIRAPHFVMFVKNILENRYGTRMVERGGLRIRTTLDIGVQEMADSIVRNQIAQLTRLKVGNGAAIVTDPKTGEILAMVGSRDYFDTASDGNVNVTTSLRQPGSSIKVVNYAAALENGFTAASIIDDSPVMYQTPGSPSYIPVNYDGRYHGPTPLRYALGNSYNIPAVKVLAKIGVKTMIDKGRLMGIMSWEDESRYGLSLTLGGGDVTMLEMAEVYGTLANLGRHVGLMPVAEVSDYTGKVIERFNPDRGVQAVNPGAAFIISDILRDNNARSAAFGANSNLVISGKTVSVKTGTSNDKRDNWTIGYTPSSVIVVWVGNNDNSPMDPLLTSGVTGAAPIWHDIMTELIKNKPDETQAKPENVIVIPCYFGRNEYFIGGTQPAGGRCSPFVTPIPTPTNNR